MTTTMITTMIILWRLIRTITNKTINNKTINNKTITNKTITNKTIDLYKEILITIKIFYSNVTVRVSIHSIHRISSSMISSNGIVYYKYKYNSTIICYDALFLMFSN